MVTQEISRGEVKIIRCGKHHKSRSCNLYLLGVEYQGSVYVGSIISYSGRPSRKAIVDQFVSKFGVDTWWSKCS